MHVSVRSPIVLAHRYRPPNDEIRTFETSNDCIGQIVVHGSDVAACHALLEHVTRSVAIDVDGPTLPGSRSGTASRT